MLAPWVRRHCLPGVGSAELASPQEVTSEGSQGRGGQARWAGGSEQGLEAGGQNLAKGVRKGPGARAAICQRPTLWGAAKRCLLTVHLGR